MFQFIFWLILFLIFFGLATVSGYKAKDEWDKLHNVRTARKLSSVKLFCSLRPISVPITEDLVFQGIYKVGPLLNGYSGSRNNRKMVFSSKSGEEKIIVYDASAGGVKTYEFALKNNGYSDLSLVVVSYFQAIWNYSKKGFLMAIPNAAVEKDKTGNIRQEQKELKDGLPRFLYESGLTDKWLIAKDFKIGNIERRNTSQAISLLNPDAPLTDVYVFNVSVISDEDSQEVKRKYIFMVRNGVVYEEYQYAKFDDNPTLLKALNQLEQDLLRGDKI